MDGHREAFAPSGGTVDAEPGPTFAAGQSDAGAPAQARSALYAREHRRHAGGGRVHQAFTIAAQGLAETGDRLRPLPIPAGCFEADHSP